MSEYEVEKILGKRVNRGKVEYQIKWVGYSEKECTWQPEENLSTCKEMLIKYNNGIKKSQPDNGVKPKIAPVQKIPPAKGLKPSWSQQKGKGKKKNFDENEDEDEPYQAEEDEEEEEEVPKENQKLKRSAPSLPGPSTRKNMRFSKATAATPISSSRAQPMISEEPEEDVEKDINMDEQETMVAPRIGSSKLGEADNTKLQILGMMKGSNETFFFKIKQNGKVDFLSRDEVMEKDPVALILFYENHIKIFPSAN